MCKKTACSPANLQGADVVKVLMLVHPDLSPFCLEHTYQPRIQLLSFEPMGQLELDPLGQVTTSTTTVVVLPTSPPPA